jgi:riboflavin transporter 2
VLLTLGVIAAISMALFYDVTAYIFNAERSVALLCIVFCFALVGCTSSVLFMPYMGRFREVYLITYLIGEGLSGFLPSIVALIQGVGGNSICVPNNSTNPDDPSMIPYTPPPNFGTRTFFFIIFALFVSSLISFLLLDRLPTCKKEHAAVKISHGNKYVYNQSEATTPSTVNQEDDVQVSPNRLDGEIILSVKSYRAFLLLLGLICMFANGVFPSIMVYSTNHYGNVVYHFAATLSSIANPVACFMAVFLPHRSIKNIILLTLVTVPLSAYAFLTAAMSPNPPLLGLLSGEILVVSI